MRTKSLFVALEVPPSCAEVLAGLNPGDAGVQWLPAEQLNLAMSRKWQVDEEEEERLCEALAQVKIHPFFLPLHGVAAYGKPPAIAVSVGIGKGHPNFFALHRHIQDAALHARLQPDLRPYHPHVTIARAEETPKAKFQRFLRENADEEFCMWKVPGFALFQVEETFEGNFYSVERRFTEG
ncbi:MAG: RNA 2',3'-cyclic phosphodiesterase [Verrucomicrobiaceae bacterium]|nr:MAG: RNA 2',3'-cyclic phosphodiesterase [Verrucomicrobiaceae bacterium]